MSFDSWLTRAPEHDEPTLCEESPICERCGRAECTPEDWSNGWLCVDCDAELSNENETRKTNNGI
jgi:hypothetical protein